MLPGWLSIETTLMVALPQQPFPIPEYARPFAAGTGGPPKLEALGGGARIFADPLEVSEKKPLSPDEE
jgi:hypothetical protein